MIYTALLVLASITGPDPQTIVVELVEVNFCYDSQGNLNYKQVIYWGTYDHLPGLHVREYVEGPKILKISPISDGRILIFQLVYGKIQIRKGLKWKETHTFYDPEERDQQWVDSRDRRAFSNW